MQHVWHSQRPGIKSFGSGRGWKSGVSHLGDGAAAPAHGVARGLGLAQVAQAQEWWQEVRELLWQQLAINKDELECDAASGWKRSISNVSKIKSLPDGLQRSGG